MITLNDTLNQVIKEGYYLDTKTSQIVKFMEFGSQFCVVAIFDKNGGLIDSNVQLMIDSENERERYEPIPYDQLPESIKIIKEIAQS